MQKSEKKIEQFMSHVNKSNLNYYSSDDFGIFFSNGDVKLWLVMIHFMFDRRLIQIGRTLLDQNAKNAPSSVQKSFQCIRYKPNDVLPSAHK